MEPLLYADKSFICLGRDNFVRKAAIKLRISIAVIFLNAVTLGLSDPCQIACSDRLCVVTENAEHVIFGYFLVEMLLKMLAMGAFGCNSYLSEPWNRFDLFIILAGLGEYAFLDQDINVQAIRSLRMLRPLRAITRIPSLRLMVSLFLDILPMLGNVFILFVFLYFAFGIVAVNLWAGLLRNRCFFPETMTEPPEALPRFYHKAGHHNVYLCSNRFGMQTCQEIPKFERGSESMCESMFPTDPEQMALCHRWADNYTECRAEAKNPHFGTLNFDNLGYAFIALFQVISLEGWSEVMYYVQDSFSFHVWIYFVLLIICGYYFAVKLCLVVITAQFSVTRDKQRLEKEKRHKVRDASGDFFEDGFYTQVCDLAVYGIRKCLKRVCPRLIKPVVIDRLVVTHPKPLEKHPRSKSAAARLWIRRNMDKPLAQTIAAGLIFLNAAIMACEHHDEPEELAVFMEISNVVFTFIFAVEVLLRLFGWGLHDFVREAFNMLDLVVSIINIIELASSSRSGFAVLRLFRILRLVKLFRFVPGLQRKLMLMLHTVDNATAYFCFFGFAMYVSALFGMSLFGCKFCEERYHAHCDFSNCTNATSAKEEEEGEECSGADFNSLRHSLQTVLQVFARDKWTSVMHTSMFKVGTWTVVYFIVLVIVGDYIFMNLLTGILVEGFSLKREAYETTPKPDAITLFDPSYCPSLLAAIAKLRFCFDGCGSDASLFFLKPGNVFRRKLKKMVSSMIWECIFLVFIVASCILVVVEQPNVQRTKTERLLLSLTSYCITAAFSIEALLKIMANGFILGRGTYMRRASNVFDFGLVCLAGADIVMYAMNASFDNRTLVHVLRPIRLLRALRPLSFISRAESLRTVLQTLIISVKAIGQIVVICCFFFATFAVLGVQLFRGCYGKCQAPEQIESTVTNATRISYGGSHAEHELLRAIKSRSECLALGLSWRIEAYNFNSFVNALTSLFVLATFISCAISSLRLVKASCDGWLDIPSGAASCVGPDLAPEPDHNFWVYAYFISFLFIGCFFALNMFVGVVVNNYQEVSAIMRARPREIQPRGRIHIRRLSAKILPSCFAASTFPKDAESPFWETYPKWRRFLLQVTSDDLFEYVIMGVVAVNIVCMSLEHYEMDPMLEEWLDYFNNIFVAMLTLEMILKVIAQGFCRYCKDSWNRLDIVVNISSLTGVVFDNLDGATLPVDPSIIRIVRIFRIFRMVKLLKVANLSVLFLLLFFIYGTMGVQLFGRFDTQYEKCDGLSRHSNFTTFGMAMLTLFRVFTGDSWNLLLKDLLMMTKSAPFCLVHDSSGVPCSLVEAVAPAYFISFLLLSQFILINIVVAMLMQQIYFLHRKNMEDEGVERGKMPTVCQLVSQVHGKFVKEPVIALTADHVHKSTKPRATPIQNRVKFRRQEVRVTVHGNTVTSSIDCGPFPRNVDAFAFDPQTWAKMMRKSSWQTQATMRRRRLRMQAVARVRRMSRALSVATESPWEEMPTNLGFPDISGYLNESPSHQFVTDGSALEKSVVSPDISGNLQESFSQQFVTDDLP